MDTLKLLKLDLEELTNHSNNGLNSSIKSSTKL